jgi:hypothetical protein
MEKYPLTTFGQKKWYRSLSEFAFPLKDKDSGALSGFYMSIPLLVALEQSNQDWISKTTSHIHF